MKINVKNFQLVPMIEFLSNINLKGKASRARIKLVNKLNDKREEVSDDIKSLRSEEDKENYTDEQNEQYQKELTEILNETSIIDLTEYKNKMPILLEVLEDYDKEMSGQEAGIHDLLLDLLEEQIKDEKMEVEIVQ